MESENVNRIQKYAERIRITLLVLIVLFLYWVFCWVA